MEITTITAFLAIGAAIFIGFFGGAIFNKYRIPDVLLLIALGMIIGPFVLDIVTADFLDGVRKYEDLLLSIALVLIIFDGGLSLDIKTVLESMKIATLITVITLALEITIVAIAAHFIFGIDLLLAFALGTIIGGTSEAVVIPIANKMRIKDQTKCMLIMESVLTDVLVIVIALSLFSIIVIGDFSLVSITTEIARKFAIGGVVGFAVGFAWLYVLQALHNKPFSYMLTVGALFLISGFVEMPQIGGSAVVASLVFGLVLGNRRFFKRWLTTFSIKTYTDEHIHHFQTEITFFVRTFFYVYIGLLFNFASFTLTQVATALGIIVIIVVVRRLTSLLAYKIGDLDREDADALFSLMPRGLASAVLATVPALLLAGTTVWNENYGPFVVNVALMVILGTTILATVLSFSTERKIERRNRQAVRMTLKNGGSVIQSAE